MAIYDLRWGWEPGVGDAGKIVTPQLVDLF
jgi:hypothetical protein